MARAPASPEDALTNALQARIPSTHVWRTLKSPALPQLLYQAPPGAQQLGLPDCLKWAHWEHPPVCAVATCNSANVWIIIND